MPNRYWSLHECRWVDWPEQPAPAQAPPSDDTALTVVPVPREAVLGSPVPTNSDDPALD